MGGLTINRLGILIKPGSDADRIPHFLPPHLGPDALPIDTAILWPGPSAQAQQLDGKLVARFGIRARPDGGHEDVLVQGRPGIIVVGEEGERRRCVQGLSLIHI